MNLSQFPTDNLYKFMAMFGLTIMIISAVPFFHYIVLDKIEEGCHGELLAKKNLYYNLWKQQSHGFIIE